MTSRPLIPHYSSSGNIWHFTESFPLPTLKLKTLAPFNNSRYKLLSLQLLKGSLAVSALILSKDDLKVSRCLLNEVFKV